MKVHFWLIVMILSNSVVFAAEKPAASQKPIRKIASMDFKRATLMSEQNSRAWTINDEASSRTTQVLPMNMKVSEILASSRDNSEKQIFLTCNLKGAATHFEIAGSQNLLIFQLFDIDVKSCEKKHLGE